MTDRHAGYIVTLKTDMRKDDAESTLSALRMIRGVASVKPLVSEWQTQIAEERARFAMGQRLWEVLYPKDGKR